MKRSKRIIILSALNESLWKKHSTSKIHVHAFGKFRWFILKWSIVIHCTLYFFAASLFRSDLILKPILSPLRYILSNTEEVKLPHANKSWFTYCYFITMIASFCLNELTVKVNILVNVAKPYRHCIRYDN